MIKVLNIISDSNIGGAGKCVLTFLKYFDRDAFEVKVALPKDSLLIPEIEKLNIEYIETENIAEKSLSLAGIRSLKKVIKDYPYDIVHTHGNMSGRIAGKQCGKKVVFTRHSVFPVSPKISKGIGKKINGSVNMYYSDAIIAVAEAAKENLVDTGLDENKIQVLLNGVEKQTDVTEERINWVKAQYGISKDDFVIGIMARIEEVKGHIYLIEAVEEIIKQNKNLKVLIIGTGSIEDDLKKTVKQKHLEEDIIFTGFIKNVNEILNVLDLQINASFGTEATSLSLLEGMSLGIPAVVSDYGGNPGVIIHGENGYIFELQNSKDLAKYILKLMNEPETYEYMKKRSVEVFEDKFTAEIYARNIETVYSELMNS